MAVIQTIRDKYAKLAGGVIVVALLGFVLMDFGSAGSAPSSKIGEVNGTDIEAPQYDARINQRETEIRNQNPNISIDENSRAQIRDQVWTTMVNEILLDDIIDKLGITVSNAELNDLLTGPNPDPMVRQAFTNPQTGTFNPQEVASTIQSMRRDPNMRGQWEAFENELIKRRHVEKFNNMIEGGIYVPQFVLDNQYIGQNSTAAINYVKLPYTLISDEEAQVTDSEIQDYMKKNPKIFEVKDASRSIEYITFQTLPSADDSARALNGLELIRESFLTTSEEDMQNFINLNSQNAIPLNYFSKEQLSTLSNGETLINAEVNSIVGPFVEDQSYMMARVLNKSTLPDSTRVRHILVKTADAGAPTLSDSEAKAKIDSAVALLRSGLSFEEAVQQFSDDAGSQATGGEYTFALVDRPSISKEFADFAFEGRVGTNEIVQVNNNAYAGYHYIEILEHYGSTEMLQVAFISKEFAPDRTTINNVYNRASQFNSKVNSGEDFHAAAQAEGVQVLKADGINENSYMIPGLGSSRELVRWSYDAKIGDVSSIQSVGDNFVVARLTHIQQPGLMAITDDNRPMLSSMVIKDKKAKILKEKYQGNTLESIAQASNQNVEHAESVNFMQNFIPGIGQEPKVVGYTFFKDFQENTVSPAISGNDGVYFINTTQRNMVSAPDNDSRNLISERSQIQNSLKGGAIQTILNSLNEAGKVKDLRSRLY